MTDLIAELPDEWHATHDAEAKTYAIHSASGDSCEVHERASGPHAEILRQLAQDIMHNHTHHATLTRIIESEAEIRAELEEARKDAAKWHKVEAIVEMAADESDGQINTACGLLLIDRAASMNAGRMELKFGGVTGEGDADLGDWIVTVNKAAMHDSAREEG